MLTPKREAYAVGLAEGLSQAAALPLGPYVYTLADEAGVVFYVGKGRGRRMHQHRKDAERGKPGPRLDHIRGILARGEEPVATVVSVHLTDREAANAEKMLIAAYDSLCNITKGGEGATLPRIDAEARKVIAHAERMLNRMLSPGAWLVTASPAQLAASAAVGGGTPLSGYYALRDHIRRVLDHARSELVA